MSEDTTEFDELKAKADKLNIKYHPKIGKAKLAAKVDAVEGAQDIKDDLVEPTITPPNPQNTRIADISEVKKQKNPESAAQRRSRLIADAGKLVRIRVSCMNPNKKEYEGEIFTVSNSIVGTFRKYVPFNADEGWYVPNMIFQYLKDKECQVFYTKKMPGGEKKRVGKLIKEFAIEVLPPLTIEEITELATKQAMSHSID